MLTISRYKTDPTTLQSLLEEIDRRDSFQLSFVAPSAFIELYVNCDAKQRNQLLAIHRKAVDGAMESFEHRAAEEDDTLRVQARFEHLATRFDPVCIHTHVLIGGARGMELFPLRELMQINYRNHVFIGVQQVFGIDLKERHEEAA